YSVLGYTKKQFHKEVPGGMLSLINPADRPAVQAALDINRKDAKPVQIQYRIRRRDGREIWLHGSYSICRIVGITVPASISVIVNITEHREVADNLRFLNEIAHEILSQTDPQKGLNAMLHNLLIYLKASRSYIFEFDPTGQFLNNTYEMVAPGLAARKEQMQALPVTVDEPWLKQLRQGQYIDGCHLAELQDKTFYQDLITQYHLQAFMLVPLRRNQQLIGLMGVDNPANNYTHISKLAALGDYASVLLTRRDDEAKLQRHLRYRAQMMQDIPGGYVLMQIREGRVQPLFINDEFCRLRGLTRQQALAVYQADAYNGIHPEDRSLVRQALNEALQNNSRTVTIKPRFVCGDGGYVRLQAYYRISIDAEGQQRLNGYFSDYSREDKEEEQRQALLDNLPQGAALLEYQKGTLSLLYLNKRYWNLVKREPGENWKESFEKAIHPEDYPDILHKLKTAINMHQDFSVKARILCDNQTYRSFHIAASTAYQGAGRFLVYATYTPISNELDTLLNVMKGGIFKCAADPNGTFAYINSSFIHKLGYTRAEFLAKFNNSFFKLVYREDRSRVRAELTEQAGQTDGHMEYRIETSCGQLRWFLNEWTRKKDPDGKYWLYATAVDISGQREAEARLRLLTDSLSGGVGSFEYKIGRLRTLYLNEGFYRYLGYSKREFTLMKQADPLSLVYEADRPVVRRVLINLIKDHSRMATCRLRVYHKQGMSSWLSLIGSISEIHDHTYIFNVLLMDITEQVNNEQQLKMSEEAYRLAVLHSNVSIARYMLADRTLYLTAKANARYQLPSVLRDVPYSSVSSGRISPETQADYSHFYESIMQGKKEGTVKYQTLLGDAWHWIEAHFSTLFSDSGKPVSAIITFKEITGQMEQEALYKHWQQSLRDRLASSYAVYRCDISQKNSMELTAGSLMAPWFPTQDSLTLSDRLERYARDFVYEQDQAAFINRVNLEALLKRYEHGIHSLTLKYRQILRNQDSRWLKLTIELVAYPGTQDILAYFLFEDIDQKQREKLKIQRLAVTDPLTGLLNRQAFADKVDFHLQASASQDNNVIMMMDLDNFKAINDQYGHVKGDETLITVAKLLQQQLDEGELACRLGGDEFILFLPDQSRPVKVAERAEMLIRGVNQLMMSDVRLSASLGLAVSPFDGNTFTELYRKADKAMYQVKMHGKNNFAFYVKPDQL
ncbi:MAG: PAS domain-containing protein, partial [Oscillospiraceae bacterium]|nr:PAS domain-containing protein [Oscillospiraceae bacterium]